MTMAWMIFYFVQLRWTITMIDINPKNREEKIYDGFTVTDRMKEL